MTQNAGCRIVRSGQYDGKQGLTFSTGVSAESAGSRGLCLHTLTIPPGGRARAHRQAAHESAIYLVSGVVDVWWGDGLTHHDVMRGGDFHLHSRGRPAPAGQQRARTRFRRRRPDRF